MDKFFSGANEKMIESFGRDFSKTKSEKVDEKAMIKVWHAAILKKKWSGPDKVLAT